MTSIVPSLGVVSSVKVAVFVPEHHPL